MWWRIILALCICGGIVAGVWYVVQRDSSYVDRPTGAGTTVIAFGDSLVSGVGARPGYDFVSRVGTALGIRIINAGLGGDTTASARERLQKDVLDRDPRVVILLLGGNDILRRVPLAETLENLRYIIQDIHGEGAAVLLLGVRGTGILSDQYEQGFADLARANRVSYVPDILGGIINRPDLMADQIHPNDSGYALMAEKIVPSLRAMLAE